MVRIGLFVTATALSLSFGAMIEPAHAQSPEYRAVPATPTTASSVIVDGTMWHCAANGCVAQNVPSRPAVACAQAVRKVGRLSSFVVGEVAFDEAALAKCNAKAKA